jgi:hypothetical protein
MRQWNVQSLHGTALCWPGRSGQVRSRRHPDLRDLPTPLHVRTKRRLNERAPLSLQTEPDHVQTLPPFSTNTLNSISTSTSIPLTHPHTETGHPRNPNRNLNTNRPPESKAHTQMQTKDQTTPQVPYTRGVVRFDACLLTHTPTYPPTHPPIHPPTRTVTVTVKTIALTRAPGATSSLSRVSCRAVPCRAGPGRGVCSGVLSFDSFRLGFVLFCFSNFES